MKGLRQQALQAKHRRKEAKRVAQHARKQFKQSKAELSELKQALAEAEAKLFKAGGRALARKLAKRKPIKKAAPRRAQRTTVIPRKKPATKRTKAVAQAPAKAAKAATPKPKPPTTQIPKTTSQTYEQAIPGHGQPEAEDQKV